MSEHERLEELAHLYPLGGLDPEERSRVDQHLATGCDRCEATLLESLRLAGQLLDAVVPVPPSPIVKRELLERARRESPLSVATPPRRTRSPAWLAAAAALLVVATGFGFYSQSLRVRSDSLRASLVEEQTSRRSAEERLRDVESRMATLTAPDARAVSLSGQGDTAGARARAFLDPENRQLSLYVYNLQGLEQDTDAVDEGGVVAADTRIEAAAVPHLRVAAGVVEGAEAVSLHLLVDIREQLEITEVADRLRR